MTHFMSERELRRLNRERLRDEMERRRVEEAGKEKRERQHRQLEEEVHSMRQQRKNYRKLLEKDKRGSGHEEVEQFGVVSDLEGDGICFRDEDVIEDKMDEIYPQDRSRDTTRRETIRSDTTPSITHSPARDFEIDLGVDETMDWLDERYEEIVGDGRRESDARFSSKGSRNSMRRQDKIEMDRKNIKKEKYEERKDVKQRTRFSDVKETEESDGTDDEMEDLVNRVEKLKLQKMKIEEKMERRRQLEYSRKEEKMREYRRMKQMEKEKRKQEQILKLQEEEKRLREKLREYEHTLSGLRNDDFNERSEGLDVNVPQAKEKENRRMERGVERRRINEDMVTPVKQTKPPNLPRLSEESFSE